MATLSVAGSQSAGGFIAQELRTQQAQRRAEQAEANARALQAQARGAQLEADQAQESARNLKVRSDQAQGEVGAARQALASLGSLARVDAGFQSIREGIADGLASLDAAPVPVVNAEGQTTGTLINVTA